MTARRVPFPFPKGTIVRFTRLDHCLIAGILLATMLGTAQQSAHAAKTCDKTCREAVFYEEDGGAIIGIQAYYWIEPDCNICGTGTWKGSCFSGPGTAGGTCAVPKVAVPQKYGTPATNTRECPFIAGSAAENTGTKPDPVDETDFGNAYKCPVNNGTGGGD
jgi:hypothetical protein